jgi:2-methylcitrate dehydratase PrpD
MRPLNDQPPTCLQENATRDLAQFAAALRFGDIPAEVVEKLKLLALDGIGCCVYGVTLPWTRMVAEMVEREGGRPVASIFGSGRKTSLSQAVLVNSTAGHAFELDDIHRESIVHCNSLALPVVVAFAEADDRLSGCDMVTAMAAGYEVGTRVGSATTTSLFMRGFHPQGTSGVFVAAATAGRMLALDGERMQNALGIAGSQAAGLMAAQEGAMVKRFHSGRAAQSGVYAALLAKDGFTGIADVLEAGYGGFLSSYSDKPNARRLTAELGSVWETENVGYKPHASVTSIHTALDALATIMQQHGLVADDIASIKVGVSAMTHVHCAWPYKSQSVTAAQMNLYYGLAVMALDGAAFVQQYAEDRLNDPRILNFIARIEACVDAEIEAMGPAFRHAARMTVVTRDGRELREQVLQRRGSPENPLKPEEVISKFRTLAGVCLARDRVDRIIDLTEQLEHLESVRELASLLGGRFGDDD